MVLGITSLCQGMGEGGASRGSGRSCEWGLLPKGISALRSHLRRWGFGVWVVLAFVVHFSFQNPTAKTMNVPDEVQACCIAFPSRHTKMDM